MVKRIVIFIALACIQHVLVAQKFISNIRVDNSEVYIGQPIKLTVSVYTSTWFTSGIKLGNINVEGALSVFFSSVSNSQRIDGKQYAGVSFYYNVFPTREGEITIPSLNINVESPPEGGFRGGKHVVKTKAKTVNVRGIPLGYSADNWLVANGLSVRQTWNASPTNVKVGDVVQRTITRSVESTLSEFLPETPMDSMAEVSIYPRRAVVNNLKTRTSISATRTETYNYLFEKEGKVVIPSIQYVYWNSNNKRFYKRVIDSLVIDVKPNPDLVMLESLRKSLQQESKAELEEEKGPLLILGLSPRQFAIYLILVIVALYLLVKLFQYLGRVYKKVRQQYKQSEYCTFKAVITAVDKNQYFTVLVTLKTWSNKLEVKVDSIKELINTYGTSNASAIVKQLNQSKFRDSNQQTRLDSRQINKELRTIRKNIKKEQKEKKTDTAKQMSWLNPIYKSK